MSMKADQVVGANIVVQPIVEYAANADDDVLDCRGVTKLMPYFSGGTHSYQPCDEDGNLITGSSSANFASGTAVDVEWPFYLIDIDASNALTIGKV